MDEYTVLTILYVAARGYNSNPNLEVRKFTISNV